MSGVRGLVQGKHRDRELLYGNESISGAWGKGQVLFASHSIKSVQLSISSLTMPFMPQRVGPIKQWDGVDGTHLLLSEDLMYLDRYIREGLKVKRFF